MESSTDSQNTQTDPESPSTDTAGTDQPPDQDNAGAAGDLPEQLHEAQEQGFLGVAVDETPNEAYTLQGVVEGQPTPETERQAADAVEDPAATPESNADASE